MLLGPELQGLTSTGLMQLYDETLHPEINERYDLMKQNFMIFSFYRSSKLNLCHTELKNDNVFFGTFSRLTSTLD